MEKSFQLDQRESTAIAQINQQRTQALATVGALKLDLEQAMKNLEAAFARQNSFVQSALMTRGVERYENPRLFENQITVSIPDVIEPSSVIPPSKANGSAALDLDLDKN